MHRSFWLGLIGAIPGVLLGLLLVAGGYLSGAGYFDPYPEFEDMAELSGTYYFLGFVSLACSAAGALGGAMGRRKALGGVLMIVSGGVLLYFTTILGAFTFVLFLIGGALLLRDRSREKSLGAACSNLPPSYPGQPVPYPPQDQAAPRSGPVPILYCPRCGARTEEPGQRYCNACGKKLEE